MSIISSIKTYLEAYTELESSAPIWVNYLRKEPTDYSIVPLGGSRKVVEYIHGNSGIRTFDFALQSNRFTANDAERIGNVEFFEALADWLDDQTEADDLPALASGLNALKIEALGFGYLYEQGSDETGVYQIQCRLEYSKE